MGEDGLPVFQYDFQIRFCDLNPCNVAQRTHPEVPQAETVQIGFRVLRPGKLSRGDGVSGGNPGGKAGVGGLIVGEQPGFLGKPPTIPTFASAR